MVTMVTYINRLGIDDATRRVRCWLYGQVAATTRRLEAQSQEKHYLHSHQFVLGTNIKRTLGAWLHLVAFEVAFELKKDWNVEWTQIPGAGPHTCPSHRCTTCISAPRLEQVIPPPCGCCPTPSHSEYGGARN